jgi:dolichol-phosphate mannosyltransferase|tara:strand:+ start:16 stop:711 length:696 start_codon:yes stop_codon:yes gene_type:complete
MSGKISIILSTCNEAKIIEKTVSEIFDKIQNVEIVLVDDNSTDGTVEKLENINNENLKIFQRKQRGLASAFLLGMINTTGKYIGWTDSNMPQLTNHFEEMKNKLIEYDLVLLSRYVQGGGDQRSKLRIFSSKILNFFCRVILGGEIKDYTSGIFLMKREALKQGVPISYGHGEFFIEFLYKLKKNNVKILELPYIQPPDEEGSKTASSLLRFFTLGLNYFIRILIIRFRIN